MSPAITSQPLLDKIAIVTGGGQGLGQALCLRLAKEGAYVVVADINEETAAETAALIRERTDRRSLALPVNVTDEAQVEAMVQRTLDEFGRLDVLVANAGVLRSGPVEEFDAEAWRFVINVNLFGYFLCIKHAARVMKTQGSGAIVRSTASRAKKVVSKTRPMRPASLAASGSPSPWPSKWPSTACASIPCVSATCLIHFSG